jgi:hypothetical protein
VYLKDPKVKAFIGYLQKNQRGLDFREIQKKDPELAFKV